ncbi:hypothetical protein PCL_00023 [Purpureocillium lilacinum]|uniref:Uncharacterized protein n=1 Tax=Purpureocillium lilacinum TaxID=33203 RepID=A0A2U3DP82_PURLI|nr:hypothetical protein PCL_00023 [Purpureocillium lilacinum]
MSCHCRGQRANDNLPLLYCDGEQLFEVSAETDQNYPLQTPESESGDEELRAEVERLERRNEENEILLDALSSPDNANAYDIVARGLMDGVTTRQSIVSQITGRSNAELGAEVTEGRAAFALGVPPRDSEVVAIDPAHLGGSLLQPQWLPNADERVSSGTRDNRSGIPRRRTHTNSNDAWLDASTTRTRKTLLPPGASTRCYAWIPRPGEGGSGWSAEGGEGNAQNDRMPTEG